MKSSTMDTMEGTFHEAKGKIKAVAGKYAGNPALEIKGTAEGLAGNAQKKLGQAKTLLGK